MTRREARPAFADVAEAHLDAVFRYLAHLVGDRHLAEDLTSATFERALRDWHRYDPRRGRPSVWLVEIARGGSPSTCTSVARAGGAPRRSASRRRT